MKFQKCQKKNNNEKPHDKSTIIKWQLFYVKCQRMHINVYIIRFFSGVCVCWVSFIVGPVANTVDYKFRWIQTAAISFTIQFELDVVRYIYMCISPKLQTFKYHNSFSRKESVIKHWFKENRNGRFYIDQLVYNVLSV